MIFTNFEQIALFLQKPHTQWTRFNLRLLQLEDLDCLVEMRNQVLARLPNPDLHMREPDEINYLRAHLMPPAATKNAQGMEHGEIIGVFDKGVLPYGMLGLPEPDAEDNLGYFLPIQAAKRAQIAHVAGCMVQEHMRGQGLHRLLLAARLALARTHNRSICASRVSLHNHASRRNMQREGMRIAWVGDIKGLKRQILGINLIEPWQFDKTQALLVDSHDFERQHELSQQSWWGVGEVDNADASHTLVFEKRLASTGETLLHIPPFIPVDSPNPV